MPELEKDTTLPIDTTTTLPIDTTTLPIENKETTLPIETPLSIDTTTPKETNDNSITLTIQKKKKIRFDANTNEMLIVVNESSNEDENFVSIETFLKNVDRYF